MTIRSDEVWIGLVELSGPAGSVVLDGASAAFATCVAKCFSPHGFRVMADVAAQELGLKVERVHWAEPYWARVERWDVEEYIVGLAGEVERAGGVRFGRFHTWDEE